MFGGGGSPQRDDSAEKARLAAEAKASEEKATLEKKQAEEAEALKRGLRGRRSLLSSAGGELGFSAPLGTN